MSRQTKFQLLCASVAIALVTTGVEGAIAAPKSTVAQETRVAQLFYPPAAGPQIIAVTGQGRASVPADLARLEFLLTNQNPDEPPSYMGEPIGAPSKPRPEPAPITEASVAPIVAALKAQGVASDKIKVSLQPIERSRYSYARGQGSISVTLEQPTKDRINRIVQAATKAAKERSGPPEIFLRDTYIQYAVNSCEAVENAAYLAAVEDAQLRANALAKAMKVQLADSPSVAELPFLGRFYSPCTRENGITEELFRRPPSPYEAEAPAVVQVYREISVTYRLR